MDDPALLQLYAENRDESAFTELVQRHLGLVYNTALRRLNGDAHHAHDVSQTVFTLLARKASSLTRHPTLTGWLYTAAINTARELIRAEQRRAAREEEAHAMQDPLSSPPNDESRQQLRPVIDDALSELNAADRDALLLRYFENRPLAHLATTLNLSEDGARMRVNRALEKLRNALVKHGVTSTATALTAMLVPYTALPAPVGTVAQISTSALAGAAAPAGIVATAILGLKLMSTAKVVSCIAAATAILAVTISIRQNHLATRELASAKANIAELDRNLADSKRKLTALEETRGLRNAHTALQTPEAIDPSSARSSNAQFPGSTDPRQAVALEKAVKAARDRAAAETRFRKARKLASDGQFAEALEEYLGCHAAGYRNQRFFDSFAEFGLHYPPALAALVQLRDMTESTMWSSSSQTEAATDLALFNRALGNDHHTLAAFDRLAPLDARRTALLASTSIYSSNPDDLVRPLFEILLKDRRYGELTQSIPYNQMANNLVLLKNATQRVMLNSTADESTKAALRTHIITSTAKNIEVLAGSGNVSQARDLLNKLLEHDSSTEATTIVRQHLMRAGHPELLPP